MATPWPPEQLWPTHHREHATELSRHLQTAVKSIDTANGNPLNPQAVRSTLIAALSLVTKLQNLPELGHLHQAIESLRAETKTVNENTTRETRTIKIALQQNTAELKENTNTTRAANEAAKEVWKASELAAKVVKDIKALGQMNQGSTAQSYASVAARGGLTGNMHNPHNQKAPQTQTLREIIVNIRDPITIASMRAMNSRSLKAHVDRAIEESSNEHVRKLKPVSANQLKSGDLSIKTATTKYMETLRQFAEDWESRIGNRATDNKAFIPTAEIKYIGWLTQSANKKTASTIVVEFSKAEDANKLIDEGLIWQGQVFQCERYDRKCRLRQCFKCHTYSHIGTQCKATTTCGYCAQEHMTRDCPSKNDTETPRKCAACHGEHEAWNGRCPTRIREKAKIRTAYNQRSRYHLEQAAPQPALGPEARTRPNPRTARPTLDRQPQENQPTRSRSLTKKVQKRSNPTDTQESEGTITVVAENMRPKRTIVRSRRALEALDPNTQMTNDSTAMEIYNIRKSKDTVMATLRDPNIDIIAIQEPWRNPFIVTTHHPAKGIFHLCYPTSEERGQPDEQIVVGDFNLHHELWGGSNIRARDREATELLDLMDDMNLTSQLQPGTITYEEGDRRTTIDLCLVTDANHDSDNLPIVTSLHLAVIELQPEKKRNLKTIEEKTFTQTLRASLPQLQRLRTKTALNGYVGATVEAILKAIRASVPTKALSPKSRTGWTEECANTLAEAKRLRRVYSEQQTEESWETYKEARNRKGRVIRKALQRAHREAVETAAESPVSLWKVAKWARNRQNQSTTVTPEIKKPNTAQIATTPGEKAALFKETFFPPPPEANLKDIDNASYSS
ncbi:hypothetical protein CSUB01_11874 [Colletotrichum sublineola]|uniref:Endonuclease/exonuclease/phosphatase domain-containing protein n=1 Tax=Colletotrichum sublineola TaxID=1173701 RepID=A0A066X684_COLSU|nr:hypothetical protein CSUB01_11874 [Colletotrichum sublineola]